MNMDVAAEYPWLAAPWCRLSAYLNSGRLPPALLLTGQRGVGKTLLAKAFAHYLLCRHRTDSAACGQCDACRLVAANTHPDLLLVEPEGSDKPIKVEAVRETLARLALRPHYGGHRVVLMTPAHLLNRYAANSVLKTLEEPDSATVFLLVTDAPEALPVTVRSRCQTVPVAAPARSVLIDWMRSRGAGADAETVCAISRGAPFPAMALLQTDIIARRREVFASWSGIAGGAAEPVSVATVWERMAEDTVDWIGGWIEELIRIRYAPGRVSRNNPDLHDALATLAEAIDPSRLFRYRDELGRARQVLSTQINRQLLMEELAIHWSRISRQA